MALPPDEALLYPAASAALDELLDRWRALGVPPHGMTGLLIAAYVAVSFNDKRISFREMLVDLADCLATVPIDDSELDDSELDPNKPRTN